jgi:hypothetical protein
LWSESFISTETENGYKKVHSPQTAPVVGKCNIQFLRACEYEAMKIRRRLLLGLSSNEVTYDPPKSSLSEIAKIHMTPLVYTVLPPEK